MKFLSTKNASKILDIHPNTLRKWADNGKIKYFRTQSNQRRYNVDEYMGIKKEPETICYCRASSYKQKDDLKRQVEFMRSRFPEARIIKDIGSGINYKRKGLKTILVKAIAGHKLKIVVTYRDRLARFGIELIEFILSISGGELVVFFQLNTEPNEKLTQDLLTILHVFS